MYKRKIWCYPTSREKRARYGAPVVGCPICNKKSAIPEGIALSFEYS